MKSSEAKEPAWNRAQVSLGASGWTLRVMLSFDRFYRSMARDSWKSMKSTKIYKDRKKSSTIYVFWKIDEFTKINGNHENV